MGKDQDEQDLWLIIQAGPTAAEYAQSERTQIQILQSQINSLQVDLSGVNSDYKALAGQNWIRQR